MCRSPPRTTVGTPHRRCAAIALAAFVGLIATTLGASDAGTAGDDDAAPSFVSIRECDVHYRVFRPREGTARAGAPAVIVAHGFMRSGEFMRGWADAIAARGIVAVTVDLCASSAPNGRHADNATDLVSLRRRLGFGQVVYMGVSAGGLAALMAASQDSATTRAVLLLDPTNAGGPARSAASRVRAPVAALVARPQVCNAWRNIDDALHTLEDATIVSLGRASHCDFEWPTDRFCRVACLSLRSDPPEVARPRIHAIALGFIEAVASEDPEAMARWKAAIGAPGAPASLLHEDDSAPPGGVVPFR
jgi:dienelactone hydrolase